MMADSHEVSWSPSRKTRLWRYYVSNPSYRDQFFSRVYGRHILKRVGKYLCLKGKKILDYGCGLGHLMEELVKVRAAKVYGLDFSKEATEEADRRLRSFEQYGGAIWADELPSSLDDSQVDVVISVELVEHLEDEELSAATREMYRVLRPGGYVVITTPNREDLEGNKTICPECGCIFHRWQHCRSWEAGSLREVLEKSGFQTVHVSETVFAGLLRRSFYLFRKSTAGNTVYPHLLYIGRKKAVSGGLR